MAYRRNPRIDRLATNRLYLDLGWSFARAPPAAKFQYLLSFLPPAFHFLLWHETKSVDIVGLISAEPAISLVVAVCMTGRFLHLADCDFHFEPIAHGGVAANTILGIALSDLRSNSPTRSQIQYFELRRSFIPQQEPKSPSLICGATQRMGRRNTIFGMQLSMGKASLIFATLMGFIGNM